MLTDRLRLDTSVSTDRDRPVRFSLNLCGQIDGKWTPLVRYDNAHAGKCHRDTLHPDRPQEVHEFLAVLPETFLAAAEADLTANAERYLDDYEAEVHVMRTGLTGEEHG